MLAFSKFVEWLFENHSMLSCNIFLLFDVLSFWPACFFHGESSLWIRLQFYIHWKVALKLFYCFIQCVPRLLMYCGPDLLVFFLYTESLQWICFHKSLRMKWQLCRKHIVIIHAICLYDCVWLIYVWLLKKHRKAVFFVTCRFVALSYEALLIQ